MNPYFSQQPDNALAASLFMPADHRLSIVLSLPRDVSMLLAQLWSPSVAKIWNKVRQTHHLFVISGLKPYLQSAQIGEAQVSSGNSRLEVSLFPPIRKIPLDATVSHCHWQFRKVRVALTIITRQFNTHTCPTTASPLGRQFRPYQNPTGLRADYANRVCAETRARHGVPIDSLLRGCQEMRNSTHWQKYRPPLGSPYNFQKFHW